MLVILMTIPGLALFYGGLGRSKNMLSVLMQVFVVFSLIVILWAIYGYSLAFGGDGSVVAGLDKVFLKGIGPDTLSAALPTIPEYVFVAFQSTFAAITVALIVGSFAERMKFGAVLLFGALWFTFAYVPMAHMVWGGGFLAKAGALDFAGGTVVHINAGVAGLVGAYLVGKRIGFGREAFTPHSLTLTMVGASLLWVGWFGFNAGSAGAANGVAVLAFINTILATAAAALAWLGRRGALQGQGVDAGRGQRRRRRSGRRDAGRRLRRPDGLARGRRRRRLPLPVGVSGLKRMLGADDAFDVFGVHGVGGITGALLTGVFVRRRVPGAARSRASSRSRASCDPGRKHPGHRRLSGVVSLIAYKVVDMVVGLRVSEEDEREGLDIASHGETAYHN